MGIHVDAVERLVGAGALPSAEGLRAFAKLNVAEASGMDPAAVRAWRLLGRARLVAGETAAARAFLAYACFLAPDDPEAWELLATACLSEERSDEAWNAASAALVLKPTWKRAALATLCADAVGRNDVAERWRSEAWRLVPADDAPHELLARAVGPQEGGA